MNIIDKISNLLKETIDSVYINAENINAFLKHLYSLKKENDELKSKINSLELKQAEILSKVEEIRRRTARY